jgi:hypothetical protein
MFTNTTAFSGFAVEPRRCDSAVVRTTTMWHRRGYRLPARATQAAKSVARPSLSSTIPSMLLDKVIT